MSQLLHSRKCLPGRTGRKASFASTIDEEMTDAASTRSDPDTPPGLGSGTLHSGRPAGFGTSFARATKYLMRRGSISKKSGSGIIETEDFETLSTKSTSSNKLYISDYGRIKDMFATELNRCSSPEEIAQLRCERAVENPIICYESEDGDDEDIDDGPSIPAQPMASLAGEHSDAFAERESEGFHQELANKPDMLFQSRESSLRELLGISSSMNFRCNASRANYLPTSGHVAVLRFPMEQQQ